MSQSPRVAIVTGAGQGIGQAIALRLAEDGIDVAVNDISTNSDNLSQVVEEIRAKGRRSIALIADVSKEDKVKNIVEKTVDELGGLDIMIANAGIALLGTPIVDMNTEDWDRLMSVNLRGVMFCYKYAAQQMIKQGRGGRIIGASSVAGKKGINLLSAYCASKFAVRGLSQSLALELAEHKITVNTYAPGMILTPMTVTRSDHLHGGKQGAAVKMMVGLPPDGPEAEPHVIASIVSYLVKPEAYFITGQSITVDGGVYMD